MLASSQNGSICIRCAFRMRLRRLQQQRSRYATAAANDTRVNEEQAFRFEKVAPKSPIRYRTALDHPGNEAIATWAQKLEKRRSQFTAVKGADGDALIRRTFKDAIGNDRASDRFDRRMSGSNLNDEHSFRESLYAKLNKVKADVQDAPVLGQVAKEKVEWDGETKEQSFSRLWKQFATKITMGGASEKMAWSGKPADTAIWDDLLRVFRERGPNALEDRIKYHFYEQVTGSRFTSSDIRNQKNMADLRYPSEWFPATRALHRTIHLHVGPTNSGKTYHALQRLEQVKSGVYAGPLRLLAHEVYSRLNAKGKQCALITGEEKRAPSDSPDATSFDMTSCTVEMTPLNHSMEVAVIDEIQMIGNAERGWAWTQALLGVMAKEVHLCGEERTVPLIKEICASVGEKLKIHRYQRLSPLQVAEKSLDGDLKRLRKGDCVISFSVMGIHALRQQIEKSTGRKVATVYGSLPPETRAQQARLFNDPNNDYDFLVASDAVGMGLNLAIKRIVFESSSKSNGYKRQTLKIADVKQIGGRAGRFRTAHQAAEADLAAAKGEPNPDRSNAPDDDTPENVGLVTTLERFDFPIIRTAMASEPEPIKTAGIFPPAPVLERFAGYFPPGTPFSYILARLHELSQMHSRFHLCGLKEQVWIADLIESIEGLSVADRNILTSCPANKSDQDMWVKLMPAYARCIANQGGGDITEITELPLETLETKTKGNREYLRALERLHKGIVVYLWLSYRFAGVFTTRALGFHVKKLVEDKIENTLSQFSFTERQRRALAQKREKQMLDSLMQGADEAVAQDQPEDVADVSADERRADVLPHPENEEAYYIDDIGSELEGKETQAGIHANLSAQTSRTGQGDFAGEEMGLEEPVLEPEDVHRNDKSRTEDVEETLDDYQQQRAKEAASERM